MLALTAAKRTEGVNLIDEDDAGRIKTGHFEEMFHLEEEKKRTALHETEEKRLKKTPTNFFFCSFARGNPIFVLNIKSLGEFFFVVGHAFSPYRYNSSINA